MRTPYQTAWRYCLINRDATRTCPLLNRILSKGNPIDIFEFPNLHVAVLNLDPAMTFEAVLAGTSREAVNLPDSTGRTALSWAAELGDLEKMKMILLRGADPNIADFSGNSSLHWCIHSVDCLTALLDAGADVDHQEKRSGDTKLLQIIQQSEPYDDVECLDLLWKRGACLNRLQGSKRAPIQDSVEFYRPNILKWLLEKPIDLRVQNEWGADILQQFLHCDIGEHSDMLEMIMDSHPDYNARTSLEEGLCHSVARYGSLAYLQVFRSRAGFLADLDVDRRSKCGLSWREKAILEGTTATELAEWRRDYQSEWSIDSSMNPDPDPEAYFAAFKDWIDSLRAAFAAAESLKKAEIHGKASTTTEERSGKTVLVERDRETNKDLRQRVPGSFPDE